MRTDGDEVHVSEEEASGASKEGVGRWVLVVGLILAIGALSAIWIFGAASNGDPNADNANVSAKIAAEQEHAAAAAAASPAPPTAAASSDREVRDGLPVVAN